MRKLVLVFLFIVAFNMGTQAQSGFNLGAFVGLPVADGADTAGFAIGLDVNYLFEINDKFRVGPATGFAHAFGKSETIYGFKYDYGDFQYIPIAAAGRFSPNEKITIGVDLGFGIGLNDGNDGGLYFRPLFGYNVSDKIMLTASYRAVSLGTARVYNGTYDDDYYYYYGGTFSIFSVGASFSLN